MWLSTHFGLFSLSSIYWWSHDPCRNWKSSFAQCSHPSPPQPNSKSIPLLHAKLSITCVGVPSETTTWLQGSWRFSQKLSSHFTVAKALPYLLSNTWVCKEKRKSLGLALCLRQFLAAGERRSCRRAQLKRKPREQSAWSSLLCPHKGKASDAVLLPKSAPFCSSAKFKKVN